MNEFSSNEELAPRGRGRLDWLPLVSTLRKARSQDYREAFAELWMTLLMSTMPIWLGTMIYVMASPDVTRLWDALDKNIGRGELFLLSASTIAPILYFMFKGDRQFPHAMILNMICAIVLVISAGLFGVVRLTSVFNLGIAWNDRMLFWSSAMIFVLACLNSYAALVCKGWHETGAAELMQIDTQNFNKEYQRRRRGAKT
jgi:hypothetical protein